MSNMPSPTVTLEDYFDLLLQVLDAKEHSRAYDQQLWSDSPEVDGLVTRLKDEICGSLDQSIRQQNISRHLKSAILNLYVHWLILPQVNCYTHYARRKSSYKAKSVYNPAGISFLLVAVVDALLKHGYIEHIDGHTSK